MKLKDLLAKFERLKKEMRALIDAPAGDGGNLSDDQAKKFDELKAEAETVETAITRARTVDDMERRQQGTPLTGNGGDRHFEDECRSFSLVRMIASMCPDLAASVDAGREREVSQELMQRARAEGRTINGVAVPWEIFHQPTGRRSENRVITTALPVAGPGSNIIATDLLGAEYIDRLRAQLVVRRLGARILTGLVGNVDIPRLADSANAGWFADNSAITPSDLGFNKISLTPKHVGAIVEFSRNMLLQSSPDIEAIVRDDFAKILAEEMDRVALRGGGPNEPTGIMSTPGVSQVDMPTAASITWPNVLQIVANVEEGEGQGSAWVMSPTTKRILMTTPKQTNGVEGNFIQTSPTELAGYPVATTTLARDNIGSPSDRSLIFGNWSDVLIGMWSTLDILVNPFESTAYSKGNVQVRGIITADIELRHTESFCFTPNIGG